MDAPGPTAMLAAWILYLSYSTKRCGLSRPVSSAPALAGGEDRGCALNPLKPVLPRDRLLAMPGRSVSIANHHSRLRVCHSPLLNTTQALVPTNPNEFDRAVLMSAFRAWLGT